MRLSSLLKVSIVLVMLLVGFLSVNVEAQDVPIKSESDPLSNSILRFDNKITTSKYWQMADALDSLTSDLARIAKELTILKVRLDTLKEQIKYYLVDSLMTQTSVVSAVMDSIDSAVWRDTINNVDMPLKIVDKLAVHAEPADSLMIDCNHVSTLDSLEHYADQWDYDGAKETFIKNETERCKHEGHIIGVSVAQNLLYCSDGYDCPVCYNCNVCGHFDLYEYHPLKRVSMQCGDRIYLIAVRR